MEPRHSPSPVEGANCAPGIQAATSAGSLSKGQTTSSGAGIRVCSEISGMVLRGILQEDCSLRKAGAGRKPSQMLKL
jgi:hypothetical protein